MAAVVKIPGDFLAKYDDGKIVGWTFTPHASNAGYYGPAAVVRLGDTKLDVDSVDGPFWHAVQHALTWNTKIEVEWTE